MKKKNDSVMTLEEIKDSVMTLEEIQAEHDRRKAIHAQRVATITQMITDAEAAIQQAKRDYEEAVELLDAALMAQAKKRISEGQEMLEMYQATANKINQEKLYTREEGEQFFRDLRDYCEKTLAESEEIVVKALSEVKPIIAQCVAMKDQGLILARELKPDEHIASTLFSLLPAMYRINLDIMQLNSLKPGRIK